MFAAYGSKSHSTIEVQVPHSRNIDYISNHLVLINLLLFGKYEHFKFMPNYDKTNNDNNNIYSYLRKTLAFADLLNAC